MIYLILFPLLFFCSLVESVSIQPDQSYVSTADAFANHLIVQKFSIADKNYIVLDDYSIWECNPEQENEDLVNHSINIMPDTGAESYPFTFSTTDSAKQFTANIVSIPLNGLKLLEISPNGESLSFGISSEQSQFLLIAPEDMEIAKTWQNGQSLIICGLWFTELDEKQRASDCGYLYILYNYSTQQFIHFNYN